MTKKELLVQGAEKYGTPLYIFDTDQAAEQVRTFRRILGEEIGLCYAMKANPFLVKQMAELTDRIEVCSMGEFYICREKDIPAEKLFISGVLKKKEEIWQILDHSRGQCCCNVESPGQFFAMAEWGEKNKKPVSLYLRLDSGSQFGMDEKKIRSIIRTRDAWPYVKIRGIHYFSGTLKKAWKMEKELKFLDGFLHEMEEDLGFHTKELEYGPGLSVPYFQGQEDQTREDLEALSKAIKNMNWKGRVTLEMGRAFAASCGTYLTRVEDVKKNHEKNICIVDGGIHQLHYDGQIRGMYRPRIQVLEKAGGREKEWNVYGSLCTVHDLLIQNIPLRGLKKGSVLAFENAGAYSHMEGMALFLSHELPGAVFYSREKGWKQIRREQQTYIWNMESEDNNGENN